MTDLTIGEWLNIGIGNGWVSEPHCATHDGILNLGDEDEQWDSGLDPCQFILRLMPEAPPEPSRKTLPEPRVLTEPELIAREIGA